MLACQRDLFQLSDETVYLNCAYMSPQLKSVEAAGAHALRQKNQPERVRPEDFFRTTDSIKQLFSRLIGNPEPQRIALIPSVSYGIATVARNLPLTAGQNIVLPAAQFPSNYYAWHRLAEARGATLRMIAPPADSTQRTEDWNDALLSAIDESTAAVAISHTHWADGTLFDLLALRARTRAVGAWLVIDGTQSVGALPISVQDLQPDALICAGYKWLMGPYATAVAYYGPALDHGVPIEENWINRADSDNFRQLVNYRDDYRPLAGRYSVGEMSNFMLMPMLEAALQQLNAWEVPNIQAYCQRIGHSPIQRMQEMGVQLAPTEQRAHHLLGLRLNDDFDMDRLEQLLDKMHIKLSLRGDAIRLSPNVYNTTEEIELLADCLAQARRPKLV